MNPDDVILPLSLLPSDEKRCQEKWALFLEATGRTGNIQPKEDEVQNLCRALGITPLTSVPYIPKSDAAESAVEELPEGSAEERPPADADKAMEEKKPHQRAAPTLTPEQEALAKAPWTAEDRRAFEHWCSQQPVRTSPYHYSDREQVNWIRQRRGVPLLPPDPPQEPMRWTRGEYQPWKYPITDDSPQPGSFGYTERPGTMKG